MKQVTIMKIGVLSAAKIGAVIGTAIGVIVGVLYAAFFALAGAAVATNEGGEGAVALFGGGVAVACIAPVFYGFASFIAGALYAFLFNVCAGFIGGLELEVDES